MHLTHFKEHACNDMYCQVVYSIRGMLLEITLKVEVTAIIVTAIFSLLP